jgi:hypothetical protein
MKSTSWFPKVWSIFHRDEQTQIQIVKQRKNIHYTVDGRRTRWNKYHFKKVWPFIYKQLSKDRLFSDEYFHND